MCSEMCGSGASLLVRRSGSMLYVFIQLGTLTITGYLKTTHDSSFTRRLIYPCLCVSAMFYDFDCTHGVL